MASKIWTLFWPPWAAGGPLLGRLGIHFWGGFWCPYGLSEVAPRTPQKRTPVRLSGPKWRPHFGCENSSACEVYTHTHMWPSAAPPPRQQTPGLERSPVSPSTASSISATTADHAFSSRLARASDLANAPGQRRSSERCPSAHSALPPNREDALLIRRPLLVQGLLYLLSSKVQSSFGSVYILMCCCKHPGGFPQDLGFCDVLAVSETRENLPPNVTSG